MGQRSTWVAADRFATDKAGTAPAFRHDTLNAEHRAEVQMQRTHVSREEIDRIINQLVELHDHTDPLGGEASEQEKNFKAFMALRKADLLAGMLSGWAIAHVLGLATNEDSTNADSHDHEAKGVTYRVGDHPATVNRAILKKFLELKTSSIPLGLVSESAAALRALDFGETKPLLGATISAHRGAAYTLSQLRLKALAHVDYRRGSGLREAKSREIVAEAYGTSSENIRTWAKVLLPKIVGDAAVKENARIARAMGQYYFELSKKHFAEDVSHELEPLEEMYGSKRLALDAQEYKDAQGLDK